MKKFPSKAEQRKHLAREVEDYLQAGGEIHEIPRGVSGNDSDASSSTGRHASLFERRPPEPRTDLADVVAAIERRKQAMKKPQRGVRPKRPRKVVVYDDFGEPVREVWRED